MTFDPAKYNHIKEIADPETGIQFIVATSMKDAHTMNHDTAAGRGKKITWLNYFARVPEALRANSVFEGNDEQGIVRLGFDTARTRGGFLPGIVEGIERGGIALSDGFKQQLQEHVESELGVGLSSGRASLGRY